MDQLYGFFNFCVKKWKNPSKSLYIPPKLKIPPKIPPILERLEKFLQRGINPSCWGS